MLNTDSKPLGRKAYGSIPHLPGSRLGPGDHHIHEGQARICLEKVRDRHDLVIVQEKLDGANVAVANIEGRMVALTRSGRPADSSPWLQHRFFHDWVNTNWARFKSILRDGERVCGEWLAQAHGTRYNLHHEPFVPFDIIQQEYRLPYKEFLARIFPQKFTPPYLLHQGGAYSIEKAARALAHSGHGALDPVEGAVWRVERRGEVEFLAKWVRPDKVDGCFLPQQRNGAPPVWNWRPDCGFVRH